MNKKQYKLVENKNHNQKGGFYYDTSYDNFNEICKKYPKTPLIIPKVRRIIVLGDIHGDMKLLFKLLQIGKVIDIQDKKINWIGKDTYVVQVGDQIDSCRPLNNMGDCKNPGTTHHDKPYDIKILNFMNKLDIQARKHGGKVISLLGNHELMNAMGNLDYVSYENINYFNNYKDKDGNRINNPYEARKYAFKPGNEYSTMLGCSRLSCVIIGSNLFVHAGFINLLMDKEGIKKREDLIKINNYIKEWLLGMLDQKLVNDLISQNPYSMFWTRILGKIEPGVSMEDYRCKNNIDKVLKILKINNLIIGHTPQSFLMTDGINGTCDNKVWRVDIGSSNAFNNYDEEFLRTGKFNKNREPQVLEILNDTEFNILK
jgi:hypothetical protein